ncbi:hypothetical protein PoB_002443100 [Plakobranchus ocellatus]|uniref:Glucose-methanol-choline oxidoreductase C-terminal domain-containing protein n=1 Tax=Plakobranchus ocellatus TaxID=259542 RepID=A0AAV3ZFF2_9GAST|nr:hypothetical protein PoB_002443100 [Plakobranchus ocellatus]
MPGCKIEILKMLQPPTGGRGFLLMPTALQLKSRGRLRLRSRDYQASPMIDPGFLTEESDVDRLVSSIRLTQAMIKTEPMRKIGAQLDDRKRPGCEDLLYDSDDYWRCYVRHFAATAHHGSGTCKMGSADDNTAVVDSRLRVKGIKSLRVADASIMPLVVSANTNAGTIMIAEKAADLIKEDNNH